MTKSLLDIGHFYYEVCRLDWCRELLFLQEKFEQVIGQCCSRIFGKAFIFGGPALGRNAFEEASSVHTFIEVGMIHEWFGPENQRKLLKKYNKIALTLPGINVGVAYAFGPFESQCLFELIGTSIEFQTETSELLLSKLDQLLLLLYRFLFRR